MEPQAASLLIDAVVLSVETANLFPSGLRERTNPPTSRFLLWLATVTNKDVDCVPREYSEKERLKTSVRDQQTEGNLRAS